MEFLMNLKGRHYLVTGGTGFIGRGLVAGLLRAGAKVRTLDNDSRGSAPSLGRTRRRGHFRLYGFTSIRSLRSCR